ncbi:MAG TPA: CBS domain-containing protein [Candidatus Acidoferrum sp.]|jgi:acetoin utilization protein AcuB|nr:CBS domain-containing protein [Candidatus Acidoferrum sp.]
MPAMQVRDVMTATPMTIDPEAPVETAVAVMRERGLRHLPVVNAEGRLIGIVTDRDLRSAMFGSALAEHLPPEQGGRLRALTATLNDVRVSHVMTWQVVTVGPQAPVAQAAAIMANVRIGSLPVVEGTRLVGIVTEHDVLKALAATLPCVKGADPDTYLW